MQIIEIIAVFFGLGNVYFLTQQKMIAWPLGIATVSLYTFIFFQNYLFSDFLLNFIYIILNIYGWWNWSYGKKGQVDLEVTTMTASQRWTWATVIGLGFLGWGAAMQTYTPADYPFPDAFTTVASLVAQFLLAKKKIENWIIWIVVDVVAIQIYFLKGLYPTAFLYAVYLILCMIGYRQWKRSLKPSKIYLHENEM